MESLQKNKARLGFWLVFFGLALWLFAGCAGMYADPGPQPARIKLSVKAKVDMQEVNKALSGMQMRYTLGFDAMGPYWEWGLYLKGKDGSLTRLKPLKPGSVDTEEGFAFDKDVTFLAPPGRLTLWLLLDVYLDCADPNGIFDITPITVKTFTEDIPMDLAPLGDYEIKRRFGY